MTKRLRFSRLFSLWVAAGLLAVMCQPAVAAQAIAAQAISAFNDRATLKFPRQITFSVDLAAGAAINSVTLEYSVDQLTCGTVIAKAVPTFSPARSVRAAWTWKMADSGSLPPGAQIRWQWRVTDSGGGKLLTEPRRVTWIDDEHKWQTLSGAQINLHWYRGSQDFGRRMLSAGQAAVATVSQKLGLKGGKPVDIYLYADGDEMREVVFYKPDWTGGLAYPENSIAIIGAPPDQEAWDKRAIAHEVAHVLVDAHGFSCLGSRPIWLDEGLAIYIEGGPTKAAQQQFEAALRDGDLIALSALDESFGADDYTVSLAYTESYSIVDFLVSRYGREKLVKTLGLLSDGAATGAALSTIYGFDEVGLETAWRDHVGAKPRAASAADLLAVKRISQE